MFLHGYGADAFDLFSLANPLSRALPNAAFAAPNAPDHCELGGPGFQWFGLREPDGTMRPRIEGARRVAPALAEYLAAELARYALDSSRLALVGFSQGTMMALFVGLVLEPPPTAIVGFSGLLLSDGPLPYREHGKPAVLLIHGSADPIVPSASLGQAASELREAGLSPQTLLRPGLDHSIDEAGLGTAARFLAAHLAPDVVG